MRTTTILAAVVVLLLAGCGEQVDQAPPAKLRSLVLHVSPAPRQNGKRVYLRSDGNAIVQTWLPMMVTDPEGEDPEATVEKIIEQRFNFKLGRKMWQDFAEIIRTSKLVERAVTEEQELSTTEKNLAKIGMVEDPEAILTLCWSDGSRLSMNSSADKHNQVFRLLMNKVDELVAGEIRRPADVRQPYDPAWVPPGY